MISPKAGTEEPMPPCSCCGQPSCIGFPGEGRCLLCALLVIGGGFAPLIDGDCGNPICAKSREAVLDEYDISGGERGKYAERYAAEKKKQP